MKRIRQLFFQNAAGERYGLNGQLGTYASDLSGLGISLNPDFADLSRGFFTVSHEVAEPQMPINMTLTFTRGAYASYQKLVNWLAAAGTITLIYNPTGDQEYWRDVCVGSMMKGELNPVGWLQAPCSFLSLTPWYLPVPTDLILATDASEDILRFPFTFTEDLRFGTDSHAALTCRISGAGHIPGALRLTCTGAVSNPEFKLVSILTGKLIGICRVAVTLTEGEQLIFSTRYNDSFVRKISAAGEETDLLDALDLSGDPFFHIPVNEPCTFSIESDADIEASAELQIFYYYRSV